MGREEGITIPSNQAPTDRSKEDDAKEEYKEEASVCQEEPEAEVVVAPFEDVLPLKISINHPFHQQHWQATEAGAGGG